MIDELTLVRVGNVMYLCKLHETEKRVELQNAYGWDEDVEEEDDFIRTWIMKHNLGELRTIRCSKDTGYAVISLDTEQRRTLRRLWEDMQEVKKTAIATLENQYFLEGTE